MSTYRFHPPRVNPTLTPCRPAFRKGQGAGAKRTTLTVTRPRVATRLPAVDRQPRPKGWHENGAHAVAPLRRVMGLGMHQQGLADVIPGERDGIRARRSAGSASSGRGRTVSPPGWPRNAAYSARALGPGV